MKRIFAIGVVATMLVVTGCTQSKSTKPTKTKKQAVKVPPLLVTENFKIDSMDWVPGGGEKVVVPDSMVQVLVKELVVAGSISENDKQSVVSVLKTFLPKGGMLFLWHTKDSKKNFGLAYYKKQNDIRIVFTPKKQIIRFFLTSDKTFKKKLVVNLGK